MVDVFSKEKRSYIMSKVKGRDTKPEIRFRKALFSKGLRYRLQYDIKGKPDMALVSKRIAIFIDGCFWHKCPSCFRKPKSNKRYWEPKIERNLKRDRKVNESLGKMGWKVIRIWEHEIRKDLDDAVSKVLNKL